MSGENNKLIYSLQLLVKPFIGAVFVSKSSFLVFHNSIKDVHLFLSPWLCYEITMAWAKWAPKF